MKENFNSMIGDVNARQEDLLNAQEDLQENLGEVSDNVMVSLTVYGSDAVG